MTKLKKIMAALWSIQGLLALVLIIMLIRMVLSSLVNSPTNDELANLPSGYVYLLRGDYIDPTHPPLVRYLVSLPLLLLHPDHFQGDPSWYQDWHIYGRRFIYHNRVSSTAIIFWTRFMVMLLTIGLGLLIYRWSTERYGRLAGLFSATLFSLEPNMLAHGRLVTNDLAITFAFFAAVYFFKRYLQYPGWKTLVLGAVVFALAQLAKFSAVLLVSALLLVAAFVWWLRRRDGRSMPVKRQWPRRFWIAAGIYVGVTIVTILLAYRFEFRTISEDQHLEASRGSEFIQKEIEGVADRLGTSYQTITSIRLPAYNYLKGLVSQATHSMVQDKWEDPEFFQYALGYYSRDGWWWYFPVTFMLKTPLGILAILALVGVLGVMTWLNRRRVSSSNADEVASRREGTLCLLIPPLIYLAVCMSSTINIGHRFILPIYPFIFVFAGRAVMPWPEVKNRLIPLVVPALGVILVAQGSLGIHPHYLSYFNELVGARDGWRYLADSNVDWGQDLLLLKDYLDEKRPEVLYLDVSGTVRPEDLGIAYLPVPEDHPPSDNHFLVVVSTNRLVCKNQRRPGGLYPWLLAREPTARIGYSIFVYEFGPG